MFHGNSVKQLIKYIFLIVLIASVALNVRLVYIFEKMEEDYWILFFKDFLKADQVLYQLESGEEEKAKETLMEFIQSRAMMYFIFNEEGHLSDDAFEEIRDYGKELGEEHNQSTR
jgi:hypothetical protein